MVLPRKRTLCFVVLMSAPASVAQIYPGQSPSPYPQSTPYPQSSPYPQGTPYPTDPQNPNQYPTQNPNQYPNQYPVPGRVPLSLPIPGIGKKTPKDDKPANSNQSKLNLRAVDGTLRELGEKNIYIEASGKRLFRFRLLEKTQFRNKDGDTVRDSLLKAGDQLSVQVSEDDPETALRVVLSGKGSMSERTDAARPFDHDSAKVAVLADTHPAGTMDLARETSHDSGAAPTLENKAGTKDDAPAGGTTVASVNPPPPAPSPATSNPAPNGDRTAPRSALAAPRNAPPVDDIIEGAREAADKLTDELPNFVVQQVTTRNYSTSFPARWKTLDVVSAEVVSTNGQEEYRNIQVNGKPTDRAIEKTGSWSTGEFVTTLEDILSPYTQASFTKSGDDTTAGRRAYVYNFTVLQENSNWRIIAPNGDAVQPAYSGSLWIDKETKNVLRIEQRTAPMPASFTFDKAESSIDYDSVRIDNKSYLLPTESAVLTCQRGTTNCTRNDIRFQNYHKFATASTFSVDK
jgi:hypothetical protein